MKSSCVWLARRWIALAVVATLCGAPLIGAHASSAPRAHVALPPVVAGELLVRLRSDFPACAHCLLAQGRGLGSVTGSHIFDRVRAKHNIQAMEPVFGGVHAAARRRAAQQRFGAEAAGRQLPDLSQVYLVRVAPRADLRAVAADLRRDPVVVSAEPNYLYDADATAISAAGQASAPRLVGTSTSDPTADLPDDPFLSSSGSWGQSFADLWGLFQIEAPAAWELAQGDGVVVAVVDTGLDIEHPDIAANVWRNPTEIAGNGVDDDGNGFVDDVHGWDFTTCAQRNGEGTCRQVKDRGPDVSDAVGHGTHIAGTIAAVGNNGIGIIGVAPQAQVMPVKALDASGLGSTQDLAEAIVYAAENGARVINTSWSGPPSDTLRIAVEYATGLGAVVVAAAGNDGAPLEQTGAYPATLRDVIAVGATTHTDAHAPFSDFGGPLDLVAPGGGDTEPLSAVEPERSVLSLLAQDSAFSRVCHIEVVCDNDDNCRDVQVCETPAWVIGGEYIRASGTSVAAPHVSGVAALVRSRHPEFTRQQVRQALLAGADDLGDPGWDPLFGYGRVNARRSVAIDAVPVAEIALPGNRAKIFEWQFPFAIRGSALAPSGELLSWRLLLRETSGATTELGRGTDAVSNGVLGSLESAHVQLGARYTLVLDVADTKGHTATDTTTFLVPNPQFATVPVPDPFDEGGQDETLSADGTRLAVTRYDRDDSSSHIWLYDSRTRALRRGALGYLPFLSGDGDRLVYNSDTSEFSQIYDFASRSSFPLPANVVAGPLDEHGGRLLFSSFQDLTGENPGRTTEAFFFETGPGEIRQLTHNLGVKDLALSRNGIGVAFITIPRGSSDGAYQVFLYDDATGTVRQLTQLTSDQTLLFGPSVSNDGSTVAFLAASHVMVIDVASGHTDDVIDSQAMYSGGPILSSDARRILFVAALDLDPTVGNEDLFPEVFLMDLASRRTTQLTDTIRNPFGPFPAVAAADATTLVVRGAGEVNGAGLSPPLARVVPRRRPNRSPVLKAPSEIRVAEGRKVQVTLDATDPDGDPVTFFAQRVPADPHRLSSLANSTLVDHRDGTADLRFKARFDEAGQYPLRVAAFDGVGGFDVKDLRLTIEERPLPKGDANCDFRVNAGDIKALLRALFNDPETSCPAADVNDDGRLSAADLASLVVNLTR